MKRRPDAQLHNPDPAYLRQLLAIGNYTQSQAAAAIGLSPRAMRYYLTDRAGDHRDAPYVVQFALECLVEQE